MGFIGDVFEGIFDVVGDVVSGIADVVGKAVNFVMDNPWVIAVAGVGFLAYGASVAAAGAAAGTSTAAGAATSGTLFSGMAAAGEAAVAGVGAAAGGGAAALAPAVASSSMAAGVGTAATTAATTAGTAAAAGGSLLEGIVSSGKGLLSWAESNPMLASTGFQTIAGGLKGLQQEKMLKGQQQFEMDYLDREYEKRAELEDRRRDKDDDYRRRAFTGLKDINDATGKSDEELIQEAGLLSSYKQRFGAPNLAYEETMNNTMGAPA